MTDPRDPQETDAVEHAAPTPPRRGRHAAPDDDVEETGHDPRAERTYVGRRYRRAQAEEQPDDVVEESLAADAAPAAPESDAAGSDAAGESSAPNPVVAAAQDVSPPEPQPAADPAAAPAQLDVDSERVGSGDDRSEPDVDSERVDADPEAPEPGVDSEPLAFAGGAGASPSDDATRADDDRQARRHGAEAERVRLPGWMLGVAGVVVLGLLAWLVIGLASGGDDDGKKETSATSSTTSAAPTSVAAESLPQVLCTGSSYVMVDTGKSEEQLLADPKGAEAQFPGSTLSTIPPGCVAGSDVRDQVVLALGPYPSIEEACSAGRALQGTSFTAYAGNAATGLTQTTCP